MTWRQMILCLSANSSKAEKGSCCFACRAGERSLEHIRHGISSNTPDGKGIKVILLVTWLQKASISISIISRPGPERQENELLSEEVSSSG